MSSLDRMLVAGSVAVVGASEQPGSVGDQVMRQLVEGGFSGRIHPVNPKYSRLHGLPCAASIDELEPADHVVLAVANGSLEAELTRAIAAGAGSITIFASCHGAAADGTPLRERLAAIAGDVPICGGNGMGFLNLEHRLRVCGFFQPYDLEPGGVTFLSHSGSLFSAMLHNRRRVRFNAVVSTGLELNTTMDVYLRWALELESTRLVALFLETIRNPGGFREALRCAEERNVPVIALKVGASERAGAAVETHSDAIAGDDAAYEALFAAHGVHRVRSMDEMLDTVELMAVGRRATAPGLGAVHDSGGERVLLIDAADRLGVSLPAVGAEATARMAAVLDPGLEPVNPVDAWGTGHGAGDVFAECLLALAADEAIGAVAFCVDLTAEERPDDAYAAAAIRVAGATTKPVLVLANLTAAIDPEQAGRLRRAGVPVLEGTETGLAAISHLFADAEHRAQPGQGPRVTSPQPRMPATDEMAALQVLASYGIDIPEMELVTDAAAAVAAAGRIGYPVVLKTVGVAHKSRVGGVVVGVRSGDDVGREYGDLAARLGPRVLVAAMAPPGLELAFGMVNDQQFGPVILVSVGGTLIEAMPGRVTALPPLDAVRARRVIDRLPIGGPSSGEHGWLDRAADALVRFSELAADAVPWARSIDVNPLIVQDGGCVAVDALVVTT